MDQKERVSRIRSELQNLKLELISEGFKVGEVGDKKLSKQVNFARAVDIILSHLDHDYSDVPTAVMISELRVKAKAIQRAWPILAKTYETLPNESRRFKDLDEEPTQSRAKESVANALLYSYTPDRFDELIKLIRNRKNGSTRLILLYRLKRIRNKPSVAKELKELKKDTELRTEIQAWGI